MIFQKFSTSRVNQPAFIYRTVSQGFLFTRCVLTLYASLGSDVCFPTPWCPCPPSPRAFVDPPSWWAACSPPRPGPSRARNHAQSLSAHWSQTCKTRWSGLQQTHLIATFDFTNFCLRDDKRSLLHWEERLQQLGYTRVMEGRIYVLLCWPRHKIYQDKHNILRF